MIIYLVEFHIVGDKNPTSQSFKNKQQMLKQVNSIIGNQKRTLSKITEVDALAQSFVELEPFIDHDYNLDVMYKQF